jgi:hypothetical protein
MTGSLRVTPVTGTNGPDPDGSSVRGGEGIMRSSIRSLPVLVTVAVLFYLAGVPIEAG